MDPIVADTSLIDDDMDPSSPPSGEQTPQLRQTNGKRARARAVASFVRPGERVNPSSAYVGSAAHTLAQTAKSEPQVLQSFLVPLDRGMLLTVGGGNGGGG
jgi:hypothetical protein